MTDYTLMPASSDKFQLTFGQLPISSNMIDNKKLTLHLFDSILPSVSFGLGEENWLGHTINRVYENLTFSPLTANFMVDENFDNWKLLFKWLSYINNNKDVHGKAKNEYSIDANLIVYNNFHSQILKIAYIDIFPHELDSITLSYREGENYLTCACTFSYDYYEIID